MTKTFFLGEEEERELELGLHNSPSSFPPDVVFPSFSFPTLDFSFL
jgi:hypothetical protein